MQLSLELNFSSEIVQFVVQSMLARKQFVGIGGHSLQHFILT